MPTTGDGRLVRLEMRGIRKSFPGVVALDNVDLTVHSGEVHLLLGENGAGKSTLMKVLSGAYRKDAGTIAIDGRPVSVASPRDALALGIRVIYQELNLVPHLSAAENIFLGATPTKFAGLVDWRRLHSLTEGLFDDLGLTIPPGTPVKQLSLAQRQMVEIAKAVRSEPGEDVGGRILVMDEPTSALTAREVDALFALIERLRARGVSIIYITHRLDELSRIGDWVTVMRDGRHVSTQRLVDTSIAALVRQMANREVSEHYPRQRVPGWGGGGGW
jgi:ribose transport system ATP-binding protein